MDRIAQAFARAGAQNRAAFVAYLCPAILISTLRSPPAALFSRAASICSN